MSAINTMIKQRREELGLSLEDVGNAIGVRKGTVQKWETGYIKNIGYENLNALSKALNIPISVLFSEKELSASSIEVAEAYTKADPVIQMAVRRVLGLSTDGISESNSNLRDKLESST